MRQIVFSSVTYLPACLPFPYFFTLSHTRQDFRKEKLLTTKCVFLFSLRLLTATFLIPRRIQKDIIKNIQRSSYIVPVFLWDFNEIWISSTHFRKILEYQILWKTRTVRVEFLHLTDGRKKERRTNGRSGRHDKFNSRFSNFVNEP
jgi:hypothetical protein